MTARNIALPEAITADWMSREHAGILAASAGGDLRLDCARLRRLDSLSLAWLAGLHAQMESAGKRLVLVGIDARLKSELAKATLPRKPGVSGGRDEMGNERNEKLAYRVGEAAHALGREVRDLFVLLSESLYWSSFGMFKKKTLLREDTVIQMVRLGSNALPIVLLLSTLIGFTLALQSGIQLEKFGATVFLASGIGISMVTEIGPVMTAVILAGRSGSAVTAEISTMVVQEEVGALHAMAANPIHFLVLPRFWAMSLTLPLLTVCSAVGGIAAGLVVGVFFFRLSPASYLNELKGAVTINFIGQALIKSLTFAWIIALVSIQKGLNVRGGADAVGKATTSCVVTCIFSIILADAVFSFIFYY